MLHFLVAIALALLQPIRPLPKSPGVRVAVQTSVWAAALGAARVARASRPATAAARARKILERVSRFAPGGTGPAGAARWPSGRLAPDTLRFPPIREPSSVAAREWLPPSGKLAEPPPALTAGRMPPKPLPPSRAAGMRMAVQTSVRAATVAAGRPLGGGPGGGSVLDRCARRGAGRGAIMARSPRTPAVTLFLESSLNVVPPPVPAWPSRAIRVHTVSIADRRPQVAPSPLRPRPLRAKIHIHTDF